MPACQSAATTWTADRLELLKRHFEAGLTCREIAAAIGVSRNAVIGKISRLKLTREAQEDARRPPRRRPGRRPSATPRQQYQMLKAVFADPEPEFEEPITEQYCCSLLELDEQRCRWPLSTPGADDFRFCGNLPIDGLPYCAGHARLAYQPASSRRAARE